MFKKKNPVSKIHDLDTNMNYAFYTITVTETDENVKNYPCVKVYMLFEDAIVKL